MAAAVSRRASADMILRSDDGYRGTSGEPGASSSSKMGRRTGSNKILGDSASGVKKPNALSAAGNKLMRLINKRHFDAATTLLDAMVLDGEDLAKSLPATVLITAVDNVAPVPFLETLMRVMPECIHKRDRKGKSALHAAVRCHHVAASVLIVNFPGALKVKSFKGLLPIHYACRHQAPVDVIDCMGKYDPESLTQLTKLGWTPLHMAIAHHAPEDTVARLCTSTALRAKTVDGARLPVHIAAVSGCTTKVAKLVLGNYPEGSKIRDGYGKTALDYVIDYKRWELSKLFFLTDAGLKSPAAGATKRRRTYTVSREDTSSRFPDGRPVEHSKPGIKRHRISSVSF